MTTKQMEEGPNRKDGHLLSGPEHRITSHQHTRKNHSMGGFSGKILAGFRGGPRKLERQRKEALPRLKLIVSRSEKNPGQGMGKKKAEQSGKG